MLGVRVAARAATLNLDLIGSASEQFAALQHTEYPKWAEVVRMANIKIN